MMTYVLTSGLSIHPSNSCWACVTHSGRPKWHESCTT